METNTSQPQSNEGHFQRLSHLLDLEGEAEKQAALQELQRRSPAEAEASGSSLINLIIRDEDSGLGGRIPAKSREDATKTFLCPGRGLVSAHR